MKKLKNKPVLMSILVVLVLVFGSYFILGKNKINIFSGRVASVATVNGVTIPRDTYDTQLASSIASYKAQGVDFEKDTNKLFEVKTQVLDTLISNQLLAEGVARNGIKASEEDVNKQYQDLLTQAGGTEKFKAALIESKLTEAQLKKNIAKQIAAQEYLSENVDTSKLDASDAEIAKFYNDYKKGQKAAGKETPTLKDLSDQIKEQIISNKKRALILDFIASLRAKAKIETNIL